MVQNGIDCILRDGHELRGARIGLITSPSGVSRRLRSTADILYERFRLCALYSPEHGIRGDVTAGGAVESFTDTKTGLPVYSLYGGENRPEPETLNGIDMLVMDVQDIGCRYYTYISTMRNAMEECAKANITFAVLDRINPIGGAEVEGNRLSERFRSFVGTAPIPQRHGMTLGELAGLFNAEYSIGCKLTVIKAEGWDRRRRFDETDLCWVNPSPNMPGIDAALLYPGTCLFEGTNLSEGRGTTKPFEMIGAPWLDGESLADKLNKEMLPGVIFRPVYFQPSASKHKDQSCKGMQIHVIDRDAVKPVAMGLRILEIMREQSGVNFEWLPPSRADSTYFIDLLAGTDELRKTGPTAAFIEKWEAEAEDFRALREKYLLYE